LPVYDLGTSSAAREGTDGLFEGEEAVLHVIERIVAPHGLRVDESSPWVDARLSDGSRVQTQFLGAPFLPSQGPACCSRLMPRVIEHDLAAVCRKGPLERRSCHFVSRLRWPGAELPFTLGRRQPADNASVDGGSTDAMDPRSVPWSVVESSAVGSRAMAERLVLCDRRRRRRRSVGVPRIAAAGVADVRREWRDRLVGSSRSHARLGHAGVARGVGGALGPRGRRGSVVATRRPPTGLHRSVRNDRRTGDRDGTNVRSRERRV
jgi:hypothetical protein